MRASAVGIFSALINSLAKIFEASNCAAFLFGPNTRSPSASNKSTIPAASWSSGPITVRSIRFSLAKRASFGRSFAGIEMFSAISSVPAFPGAQKIRSASGDWASFHTRPCSRPPLPTTRIFTGASVRQPTANGKNQPAGNKFGSVARDRETDSLRGPNHRRVHADHFTRGIREWPAGVSRIQCGVGLNDVIDQSARLRVHGTTERTDYARGYARLKTEGITNGDCDLADA